MAFQFVCIFQSIAKMISVANGLGKTIVLIDPVKLLAVQKVASSPPVWLVPRLF